jgi:hypothetical protein
MIIVAYCLFVRLREIVSLWYLFGQAFPDDSRVKKKDFLLITCHIMPIAIMKSFWIEMVNEYKWYYEKEML